MTFEEVYKENAEMVLNLAYRMTGREEAAKDLTQDIFLKVYEKQDTFREQSKASTWVYRIAMNHIINYLKRERRVRFFDFNDEASAPAYNGSTFWEENMPLQPDHQLEDGEKELIIRKLIDELPVKYRIPLVLFRYEELSYQDIAQLMAVNLSTVETRIHRAKKKLAEKLKPWLNIL